VTSVLSSRIFGISEGVRLLGPAAALVVVAASLLVNDDGSGVGNWQIAVALVALAAGVPHGAVDHLIIRRPSGLNGWARFVVLYSVVGAVAIGAILLFPRIGFIVVVVMTILHFGSGDAAFAASYSGAKQLGRLTLGLRVLAGGSIPILLPLTDSRSVETLSRINVELVGWLSDDSLRLTRTATLLIAVAAIIALAKAADWQGGIELLILAALCLTAPPLVAFAVYFSMWHALRHTARLAQLQDDSGAPLDLTGQRLARVALLGTPALIGFTIAIIWLWPTLTSNSSLSNALWFGLAVVWGLTVPHMALVSRLDRIALK
jgi:beta-carotene 15,15'-dioxygenase